MARSRMLAAWTTARWLRCGVYAPPAIASHEATIAIGDAENDQAFLRSCGLAVAVDNALTIVKEMADVVTTGARGAGVAELVDRWLAGGLDACVRGSTSPKSC